MRFLCERGLSACHTHALRREPAGRWPRLQFTRQSSTLASSLRDTKSRLLWIHPEAPRRHWALPREKSGWPSSFRPSVPSSLRPIVSCPSRRVAPGAPNHRDPLAGPSGKVTCVSFREPLLQTAANKNLLSRRCPALGFSAVRKGDPIPSPTGLGNHRRPKHVPEGGPRVGCGPCFQPPRTSSNGSGPAAAPHTGSTGSGAEETPVLVERAS